MKLSILDQVPVLTGKNPYQAIQASIELAIAGDKLGYTRYWTAEHHDMEELASPAPDILLSQIGAQTNTIRIGSGAVLLPHYKAYQIAERYNMLATMFPGRVDLGVGRAPGGSAEATMALNDNFLESLKHFPTQLDELIAFCQNGFSAEHMFSKIKPTPVASISPKIWLLGTSAKSGKLAAEKGISYAFGHFMSDDNGAQIVRKYTNEVKDAGSVVAVSVICAKTTEEAEEQAFFQVARQLWKEGNTKGGPFPTLEELKHYSFTSDEMERLEKGRENIIVGNPVEVKTQLEKLQAEYQVEELMLVTITSSYESRLNSYELIAQEMKLT
ncbi:LLM class flavin-dependent oxidoreductase [Oceanobacillus manasiensis]|uniref:LLM class flavin-dependent oxidoreductase n=1 Tax=Oceanobacillus manasiensis TaxID=586413 RepID=UPI0005A6D846|nr:LLM class flavin-dependent oxidoreductase [Oceanobacillus manasiensis]